MVLKESGQTEDDGCDRDGDDVTVRSLYGAESLGVQRSAHSDVPINCQQNSQPGIDHTQHVRAWKQPAVEAAMDIPVVNVVEQRSYIT